MPNTYQVRRCPFCGTVPILTTWHHGRFFLGCDDTDCPVMPHLTGPRRPALVRQWNDRLDTREVVRITMRPDL